jgi:hypothetical protein
VVVIDRGEGRGINNSGVFETYSGGTFNSSTTATRPTNWQLTGTGFNLTGVTGE